MEHKDRDALLHMPYLTECSRLQLQWSFQYTSSGLMPPQPPSSCPSPTFRASLRRRCRSACCSCILLFHSCTCSSWILCFSNSFSFALSSARFSRRVSSFSSRSRTWALSPSSSCKGETPHSVHSLLLLPTKAMLEHKGQKCVHTSFQPQGQKAYKHLRKT